MKWELFHDNELFAIFHDNEIFAIIGKCHCFIVDTKKKYWQIKTM